MLEVTFNAEAMWALWELAWGPCLSREGFIWRTSWHSFIPCGQKASAMTSQSSGFPAS